MTEQTFDPHASLLLPDMLDQAKIKIVWHPLWKSLKGTPLENDLPVLMVEFAQSYLKRHEAAKAEQPEERGAEKGTGAQETGARRTGTDQPDELSWEYFCDRNYYDQWAVRKKGESRWGHCFHVPSLEEAKGLAEILNTKAHKREAQQPDDLSDCDGEMAKGALEAIHAILDDGSIPRGTFADDHVRNLVALYNLRGDRIAELEGLLKREASNQGILDNWQPIETAPKDGLTTILGYIQRGEFFYQDAIWFDERIGEWTCGKYNNLHPTHWMPLPQPPVNTRRGSDD